MICCVRLCKTKFHFEWICVRARLSNTVQHITFAFVVTQLSTCICAVDACVCVISSYLCAVVHHFCFFNFFSLVYSWSLIATGFAFCRTDSWIWSFKRWRLHFLVFPFVLCVSRCLRSRDLNIFSSNIVCIVVCSRVYAFSVIFCNFHSSSMSFSNRWGKHICRIVKTRLSERWILISRVFYIYIFTEFVHVSLCEFV